MTNLIDPSGPNDHEQVVFCQDRAAGLRAIVAIHSTRLGPSLGGTRFYPFATEQDALADVLKLSRAMTYKSAAAGLDLGGGKAVVIGDPRTDKTEELLRSYARFVNSLGGRYVTTEDVGTTEADMAVIREETAYVTGLATERGGSGDPSEATAWGLFCAMRTMARRLWDRGDMHGSHVAVQGYGKVGAFLVGHLRADGCKVTVADVSPDAVRRLERRRDLTVVEPGRIYAVDCDIFAPCALGGTVNEPAILELGCRAILGSANNQLATPQCGKLLAERGIVYAPDFIVNAGGVINIAQELDGYDRDKAFARVAGIADTLERVLDDADEHGITAVEAAERLAEARFDTGRGR